MHLLLLELVLQSLCGVPVQLVKHTEVILRTRPYLTGVVVSIFGQCLKPGLIFLLLSLDSQKHSVT